MRLIDIRDRTISLELAPEDTLALALVLAVAEQYHLIPTAHLMLCQSFRAFCEAAGMAAVAESEAVQMPDDWSLEMVRERHTPITLRDGAR